VKDEEKINLMGHYNETSLIFDKVALEIGRERVKI